MEGGLATAIMLIAVGSGGVRSSVAPFIGMSQVESTGRMNFANPSS
jgi:dipeptide/tripeptide permease